MKTLNRIEALRAELALLRSQGQRIALVPTMGNLHAGHLALIKRAREEADIVVASIFVNPLQFGPNEDLDAYPRTLAADQQKLNQAGCDLLFTPSVAEIYPRGTDQQTRIEVPVVSEGLCGASRPGHFSGVATVVCKLFHIVQPNVAVFGEKDYQQLMVIRKMVADLDLPIEILGQPIARAADQLALSSRNGYLSEDEQAIAPALYQQLQQIAKKIQQGAQDLDAVLNEARAALEDAGLRVDYLELRNPQTLEQPGADPKQLIVLGAVYLGSTRLIDNLVFERQAAKAQ